MLYTACQSLRNITAFAKYQFSSLIVPSDSFVNLGFSNCKQRLSLSNLTNSASRPAIKCYCFTQTTMTEHDEKVRWQRLSPLLTTVSFRQINFVLEQNVLNDTGSVPVGKALPSTAARALPPPAPWQFAKIVHSHQLSLRLQAAVRRKTIGSWVQNTSLLDADCSSIDTKGAKKSPEVKTQYHNTGYLSLSPPLHPSPTPRDFPLAF